MSAIRPYLLQSQEILPSRPFTHPRHVFFDTRLLNYLILRLCHLFETGLITAADQSMKTIKDFELDGRQLRQIVVQADRLIQTAPLKLVGFFGQRRIEVNDGPIKHGDDFLVNTLDAHQGLLSYSTIELTCGNFANCVLFESEEAKNFWGRHPEHARLASELSPHYYSTIRLYNGLLANGLNPDPKLTLTTVKYYDFSSGSLWRGERKLPSKQSNQEEKNG